MQFIVVGRNFMRKLSLRVFRYHRQTAIISDEHVPPKLVAFTELSLTPKFEYKGMTSFLSSTNLTRKIIPTQQMGQLLTT
jgi:hypothetical protein